MTKLPSKLMKIVIVVTVGLVLVGCETVANTVGEREQSSQDDGFYSISVHDLPSITIKVH